jgi:hypothetical protein
MKGDFSRCTHDESKRYSGVLMQQGRVLLDADWNEQLQIGQNRTETEAIDVIGRCGAPEDNAGFGITLEGDSFKIGRGRYYVDGILCENFEEIPYTKQEDLPNPPLLQDLLSEANALAWIVYLHVWKRHITALDDPKIREVALGGPDTCNRVKTIWQVEILPVGMQRRDGGSVHPVGLLTKDCEAQIDEWDDLVEESAAMMSARTAPTQAPRPCTLPPGVGYTGQENQLYRVEIHTVPEDGSANDATYKWSRENGSVVFPIVDTGTSGNEITVSFTGRDRVLGLANGDWVEISDDEMELKEGHGQLVQIVDIDHATSKVTILPPPPGVSLEFNPGLHPKMRRWDQKGISATPDGVKIPPIGEWRFMDEVGEEGGIQIMFSAPPSIGTEVKTSRSFRPGDYWLFPARTATGDIEWPKAGNGEPVSRAPVGIDHHYCRLGVIFRGNEGLEVIDCRNIFPPLTEVHPGDEGEEGMHIVGVQIWNEASRKFVDLKNDDIVTRDDLLGQFFTEGGESHRENFLKIECDMDVMAGTVTDIPGRLVMNSPTCYLTIDLPIVFRKEFAFLGGFSKTVLASHVGANGKQIFIRVPQDGIDFLQTMLATVDADIGALSGGTARFSNDYHNFLENPLILVHLTLKGNFIYSIASPRRYLDGEAYGVPSVPDVPPGEKPHDLDLPSGDHRRGGDFEMWFWINLTHLIS